MTLEGWRYVTRRQQVSNEGLKGLGEEGSQSGENSPESQDRGENTASPGAGRPARPPGPEERLKNVERINHLA